LTGLVVPQCLRVRIAPHILEPLLAVVLHHGSNKDLAESGGAPVHGTAGNVVDVFFVQALRRLPVFFEPSPSPADVFLLALATS
jgi:hypothetical protein